MAAQNTSMASIATVPNITFLYPVQGNVYFSSYRDGNLDLYVSERSANGYEKKPVTLGAVVNSQYDEHDPLIAPDESFLVFPSDRPGGQGEADLYISHIILTDNGKRPPLWATASIPNAMNTARILHPTGNISFLVVSIM